MAAIRPATEADDATIRRMVKDEGLDMTSLKWQHFVVAEQDGQIVGIGQVKDYPGCQELGSLTVLPAYRGQGIASAIIRTLEASAPRPLYLMCLSKMIPYYERFGYQRIPFREAPGMLRLKLAFAFPFRLIGMRANAMRKD